MTKKYKCIQAAKFLQLMQHRASIATCIQFHKVGQVLHVVRKAWHAFFQQFYTFCHLLALLQQASYLKHGLKLRHSFGVRIHRIQSGCCPARKRWKGFFDFSFQNCPRPSSRQQSNHLFRNLQLFSTRWYSTLLQSSTEIHKVRAAQGQIPLRICHPSKTILWSIHQLLILQQLLLFVYGFSSQFDTQRVGCQQRWLQTCWEDIQSFLPTIPCIHHRTSSVWGMANQLLGLENYFLCPTSALQQVHHFLEFADDTISLIVKYALRLGCHFRLHGYRSSLEQEFAYSTCSLQKKLCLFLSFSTVLCVCFFRISHYQGLEQPALQRLANMYVCLMQCTTKAK